jgi:protein-disulfide isomerase
MRFPILAGMGLLLAGSLQAQTIPLSARTVGSQSAPVTVYEMSDFQCPFCRQHAMLVFPTLMNEYIRAGKVKWVFINFPLTSIHPNAVAAASFAMCSAKHNRFWPAHDLLFRHQEVWAPLQNPAPFLLTLVDSLSLPREAMNTCLAKGETVDQIKADADRSAKTGAQSTPSFYIEGGMMIGVKPVQVFRQVLDSIYAAKTKPKT